MVDWVEGAKVVAQIGGAIGIGVLAKLYHNRVIAKKDVELERKAAELDGIRSELKKAEARADDAEQLRKTRGHEDLAELRKQMETQLERVAQSLSARAASLYLPVYSQSDESEEAPRGFAFVAVYNADANATKAVRDFKMIESWGVVGECWDKGTVISDNDLQANVRHMASYDKSSRFTAMHTLVAPVSFQNRQIGVLQVFNKSAGGTDLDPHGFNADDRKSIARHLTDTADGTLAMQLNYFRSDPTCMRFLGVHGELDLENAVIMYADLTRSSSLYSELPLLDAARLINRFDEELYRRVQPHGAVVEKFNGDGTMIRFHYGGFDPASPERNPAYRAVSAAADIIGDFPDFKARHWKPLADDIAANMLLRVTIALGPVISTNIGPRQFQFPTVLGQCVNRAAKMAAHAPRDRDVVLVDDTVRKALLQLDRNYANTLRDYDGFADLTSESLARHSYYELDEATFTTLAARTRRRDAR